MKYCIKTTALVLLSLLSNVYAGVDFAAIGLPKNIQTEMVKVQSYIAHQAKKLGLQFSPQLTSNMHITLKELADLTPKERAYVTKTLSQIAKNTKKFPFTEKIKLGKVTINTKTGLVKLQLAPGIRITHLATTIEKSVNALVKNKKIKKVSDRMDFPNKGHITLGYLKAPKAHFLKQSAKHIENNFKNSFNTHFVVDRFVLLKSNSPATPRVYHNKGTFFLKK